MLNVVPLKKRSPKSLGLCQYGHHKWQLVKDHYFDSKQGKLVTLFKSAGCGKENIKQFHLYFEIVAQ